MDRDTKLLKIAADQLDSTLETQWNRVGMMQKWLEDHASRLDSLNCRVDDQLLRLEQLLRRR